MPEESPGNPAGVSDGSIVGQNGSGARARLKREKSIYVKKINKNIDRHIRCTCAAAARVFVRVSQ